MNAYNEASLIVYPSGYKESKIYAQKPIDGSGDLTFARASSATRVNEQGLIETAAIIGDEMVANGDFASDTIWAKDAGWTIANGKATCSSSGRMFQAIPYLEANVGATVIVTFDVVDYTSGSFVLNCYGAISPTATSVGTYSFIATTVDNTNLYVNNAGVSGVGSIDNISVKLYAATNIPRIDYTGGGCGKLLLEPQRTNIAEYSNDFNSWGAYGTPTITSGQSFPFAAEDSTLIEFATSSSFVRLLGVDVSSGTHTISFWAKKSVSSSCLINADGKTGTFNFDTGVFASGTATGTMVALTDGWFKCTMTFLGVGATAQIRIQGVSYPFGAYFFGFQIEAGSYPTSLINTSGTTVTRVADESSTTGLSSAIGQTEGVLYAKIASFTNTSPISSVINISDGSSSNQIAMWYGTNLNEFKILIRQSGNKLFHTTTLTDATQFIKVAVLYKSGGSKVYINGSLITSSTSPFTFTNPLSVVDFSGIGLGNVDFNGKLQELQLFPSALDDATLATLTTL